MTVSLVHTSLNAEIYSAATAIIRYTYIRSSLQSEIQAAIKRNAFIFKTIFIAEAIGILNLIYLYLQKSGTEKFSTISYVFHCSWRQLSISSSLRVCAAPKSPQV